MTNFPEIRGLVRATPLADGRVTHDPEQVDCARSKPPPESARKRVLGVFFSRFTVCFGCLFLCEVHLPAQVWNGTTGVNWTTGANWAGGLAPVSTGTATFNAPTPFSPTINTAVATGSLLFTGTASQNFSGGNTLTLNGVGGVGINNQVNYAPTFANPITLGASQTWQAANAAGGGMTFNGTINLGANTLILGPQNVANSIRINRVIAGTGALNKTGVGSVVLTGANTFSGGTTVTAGTLQVGSATTTGSVSGNIANAGAVVFNRSNAHTYAGLISGTGSVTQAGAGTLTLTGANTYTGGTTINTGSTLQIGGGSTTGSITGDVVDNGTLIFNRSNALTFGGNISGSGAVTKIAAGTLTLSGDNSYTGVTTINAGTLVVSSSAALGSTAGGTTVANNAALELSNNISIGAESLSLAGDGSGSGASALGALRNLSGSNSFGGAVTLTAATRIRSDAGSLTLSGPVSAANFSLSVTGPGDTIIQGAVALGSGGIVKGAAAADTGTVVLSGNNSYNGPTTVSFGTLVAASNNALGSTAGVTTVASGASLGVQGGITLTGEAMTINGTGLGGNGAIRNLSGLNTLTGPVTLSGNSEIQSDAGSLSLSGGVTGTNRTLTLDGAGNTSLTGNVTLGSGGIIKNGTGLAVLSGTNSYSGGTTINAGTVRATGGNAIGNASTVTLADVAGATLDLEVAPLVAMSR
ncbi:MAG: autotransporter-associated beta strand repeat-containing protein, partial [Terrimicrobiaceae bacterium]